LLLFHEVSGGCTIMYFSGFMYLSGELENSLGGCGLTRINVGKDTDISLVS